MSPAAFDATYKWAYETIAKNDGRIDIWYGVGQFFSVRPVINLKSDVKISGGIGTINNPYIIDTSNN